MKKQVIKINITPIGHNKYSVDTEYPLDMNASSVVGYLEVLKNDLDERLVRKTKEAGIADGEASDKYYCSLKMGEI